MRSFLKDYGRVNNMNTQAYDPVSLINKDLDVHPDWKIIQIVNNDNYHFYVVFEIKQPRKPRAKKTEVIVSSAVNSAVDLSEMDKVTVEEEKPWTGPSLEEINNAENPQVEEVPKVPDIQPIPKMIDLVKQSEDIYHM